MSIRGYDAWKTRSPDGERTALDEARDRIRQLEAALADIIEMADEQADVDDGMPNLAMRILVVAEKAL
jgi:uncharacterized protein YigA (DUF484 family)